MLHGLVLAPEAVFKFKGGFMPSSVVNSKTDICNLSMDLIGATKVNSIDTPESEREYLLRRWYDTTRRALLQMYAWNFATKRKLILRSISTPVFGEEIPYELPDDYLMFISAGAEHTKIKQHKVEGGFLYLNKGVTYEQDGSLPLRYTSDFEVVTKFSPLFIIAFSQLLAANTSFQETNSRSSVDQLKADFAETLKTAATQDAKESPVQLINRFRSYLERQ